MPCLTPIDVKGPQWSIVRRYIAVPCGRCVGCRLERARQWTIRIMHEAQEHRDNCFITLTYRDEELKYGSTQATLCKDDLQRFWKRLRKEVKDVRYFAAGEYGERGGRPHYHACLFGCDFPDKTLFRFKEGADLYHSDMLDRVWGHGHTSVGALTFSSAAYVARYILDKRLGKEADYYDRQGIEPEYVVMSRGGRGGKGGIGQSWFKKYASDIYPADRVVQTGGTQSRPPRYYDELRKKDFPEEIRALKVARMEAQEKVPIEEKLAKRMISKIRYHEKRVKSFSKILH